MISKILFMALSSQARVDWKIIRVVSEVVDEKLPYDKLPELRARMAEVAYKHTWTNMEIECLCTVLVFVILFPGCSKSGSITILLFNNCYFNNCRLFSVPRMLLIWFNNNIVI